MAPQNNTKILFVSSHSAKIILSKSASALAGIKAMIPTILAVTAIKKKKKKEREPFHLRMSLMKR